MTAHLPVKRGVIRLRTGAIKRRRRQIGEPEGNTGTEPAGRRLSPHGVAMIGKHIRPVSLYLALIGNRQGQKGVKNSPILLTLHAHITADVTGYGVPRVDTGRRPRVETPAENKKDHLNTVLLDDILSPRQYSRI